MAFTTKLVLCLLLLAGIFLADVSAAAPKKTAPPSTRGKVVSVDVAGKSITIEAAPGAPPQKCAVNDFSTIEINNKTSTIKQVKSGLFIRSVRLDTSTPPVVEDLDLTTRP